jgi:hypothetical protein
MNRLALVAPSLLWLVLAAGCTVGGGVPATRVVPQASEPEILCSVDVARALAYFRRLRGMSPAELKGELAERQAAYAQDPSSPNRMQLVLVLVLPGGPGRNELGALSLLEASDVAGADDLCLLLRVLLESSAEREHRLATSVRELREQRQRAATLEHELREAQARGRALEQRLAAQQRSLLKEREHALEVDRQLEALRNIERSLEARRGSGGPPARPSDENGQGQSPAGR